MVNAQEKACTDDDHKIEDLNNISKCAVKATRNDRENTTATKNLRFFKRRKIFKKQKVVSNTLDVSSNNVETISISISDLKNEIILVSNLFKEKTIKDNNVIDFNRVQNIPQFLSCRNTTNSNNCFNAEMSKHIKKFFTYPEKAIKDNLQGQVLVQFTIDDKGDIKTIQVSGPKNSDILKEEAKRVVKKLPKFIPATHNGKTVFVKYSLPINFSL